MSLGDWRRHGVSDPECAARQRWNVDAACGRLFLDILRGGARNIVGFRAIFGQCFDIELRMQSDVNTSVVHGWCWWGRGG